MSHSQFVFRQLTSASFLTMNIKSNSLYANNKVGEFKHSKFPGIIKFMVNKSIIKLFVEVGSEISSPETINEFSGKSGGWEFIGSSDEGSYHLFFAII